MIHHNTAFTLLSAAVLASAQDTVFTNPLLQPPRPSIDTATIPPIYLTSALPTATITDNFLSGPHQVPTATREVVTAAECVNDGEQIFSIETDTVIHTGPITYTPICGQSATEAVTGSMTTQAIVTGGGGNATATPPFTNGTLPRGSTVLSTTLVTSTMDEDGGDATTTTDGSSEETGGAGGATTTEGAKAPSESAEPAMQSGNVGGKVNVAVGLVGVMGAVAGVVML